MGTFVYCLTVRWLFFMVLLLFNGAFPNLTSYSFLLIHFLLVLEFVMCFAVWIKKETKKTLLLKSLHLLARLLKTATGYFIYVPPYALFILLRCDKRNFGTSFIIPATSTIQSKFIFKQQDLF